jgi:hypothetical protein
MVRHLAGGKISRSHSTVTEAALRLVTQARRNILVEKILLGPIRPCRSSGTRQRIKVHYLVAGLRVTVRGSTTIQDIYLYTADRKAVAAWIADLYSELVVSRPEEK